MLKLIHVRRDPTVGPAPFSYFVLQKGYFLPIPSDRGHFVPPHFDISASSGI